MILTFELRKILIPISILSPRIHTMGEQMVPSRPHSQVIAESLLLSTIDAIAIIGNVCVLLAIGRNAHLRTISNVCAAALAASDLFMAISFMPLSAATLARGEWTFGATVCRFHGFGILAVATSSIFTMGLTSVSRYFAVVRPNRFKTIFTRRRTTAFIATAWLAAFAISSPPHFFRPSGFQFHPGKVMCMYDFQRDIVYSLFLDLFVIGCTLAVITICYVKIFQEVSRTNKVFSQQNDMDRLRANIKEAKVTKSLVAVVVGFFMCWGPIAVIDVIDMVRRSSAPLPRQVMCC